MRAYYRAVSDRALTDAWRLVTTHLGVEVVLTGILTALSLWNHWPESHEDWVTAAVLPVSGVSALMLGFFLLAFWRAPFELHSQLQESLDRFKSEPVEIVAMGWPVEHEGILLFPVRITNRSSRTLHLDVDCLIEPPEDLVDDYQLATVLAVENDPIPEVATALSSAQRAEGHLRVPVEIRSEGLRSGYLAYRTDGVRVDTWCRVALSPSDAVTHVTMPETEAWPSIWPNFIPLNPPRSFSVSMGD